MDKEPVHISEIVDEAMKEVAKNSTGRSDSARDLPRAVSSSPGEEVSAPCWILLPGVGR